MSPSTWLGALSLSNGQPPKLCAGADEAEALEQDFALGEIHQRFPLCLVFGYEII
jgi:hypothetical protein